MATFNHCYKRAIVAANAAMGRTTPLSLPCFNPVKVRPLSVSATLQAMLPQHFISTAPHVTLDGDAVAGLIVAQTSSMLVT